MQLDTNNYSAFLLRYHLITCIKYRNKVIDGIISNCLKEIFERIDPIYNIMITNQRLDNLYKKSTKIANQYDIVCIKSLDMKTMSNHRVSNGKATLDNRYGKFPQILKYKLVDRGKRLITVDKWFSSNQICHNCGTRHPEIKNLRIRIMDCDCGYHIYRGQRTALNIRQQGLRLQKQST